MKITIETSGERDERVRKSKLRDAIIRFLRTFGYSEKEISVHVDVKDDEVARNIMEKVILGCALQCPCPDCRNDGGRDICTREEGACEYQMLEIVNEDLMEE